MTEKAIILKRLSEEVERWIENMFEEMDYKYGQRDYTLKPSEIQEAFKYTDLADWYEDWFKSSAEEEWT